MYAVTVQYRTKTVLAEGKQKKNSSLDHGRRELLVSPGERREALLIGDEDGCRGNYGLYGLPYPPLPNALWRQICRHLQHYR